MRFSTLKEQREVAMGAARSYLRRQGIEPSDVDYTAALAALDDIAQINPKTIAALWYLNENTNQTRLFRREWRTWQVQEKEHRRNFGAGLGAIK